MAHAGHFRQMDADLVHGEPGPLAADDSRVRDFDDGREQVVALGPNGWHGRFRSSECILRGGDHGLGVMP